MRPPTTALHAVLLAVLVLAGPLAGAAGAGGTAVAADGAAADGPRTTGAAVAGPGETPTADGDVLVVDGDDDGDDHYPTIQAAVDAATSGDTVRVLPGTYPETVTVDTPITLRAPRGATLDGSSLADADAAITLGYWSSGTVTIAGFTVTGYDVGLDASDTRGDWVVRNSSFRGFYDAGTEGNAAVRATGSTSDWAVVDSTFVGSNDAIEATRTEGDWVVRNSTFRDNGYGIDASYASGAWLVVDSTFAGGRDGVEAWYADDDWTIRNSTFRRNREGVYAEHTDGDWLIVNSTFRNNTYNGVDAGANAGDWTIRGSVFNGNEFALNAVGAGGRWTVRRSTFVNSDKTGILAIGSEYWGDGRRNWWGNASGPDIDDCYGNADCSDHLTAPPDGHPALYEQDPTAWNRTPVGTLISTDTERPTPVDRDRPLEDVWPFIVAVILIGLSVGAVVAPLLYIRRYGLQ